MADAPFDASKYLTDLGGKEYLEVKWRLLWLRTLHPDAVIETELIKHEAGLALFRARVALPGGGVATGWGSETADDFEDYIEKAETKSLGRALAALGYGTQFCEDFDFSTERRKGAQGKERRSGRRQDKPVVDAPVGRNGLKVIRDREGATSSQIRAIFAIGRRHGAPDDASVEARCRAAYGRTPNELSKQEASEFIDALRKPEPAAVGQ
ncbi:MAG: hypothetical protein WD939_06195 [Dehalococcoidia bacterium]